VKAMTALRMPSPRVTSRPALNALVRLGALVAAVSLWVPVQAHEYSLQARWGVGACLAAMSVTLFVSSFLRDRGTQQWSLMAAMACAILGFGGLGYFSGLGVHSVSLQMMSVVVLAAGVMLHPLHAWVLALLGWAVIGLLAWALPGESLLPGQLRTVHHAVVHGIGVGLALFLGHVLHAILNEKERRMAGMLRIAARIYWEVDARQRLTILDGFETLGVRLDQPWAGVHWSRMPGLEMDEHTALTLSARLDARQPFEDLPVRLLRDDGGVREVTLSGEPRHDAWGRFQGFWGVARDMTPQMAAQREVAASEVRYRELFAHCPLPLVLHRSGVVLDANPAAVDLFDHADVAAMKGSDIFDQYVNDDGSVQRGRARAAQLLGAPPGTVLPQARFRIRRGDGEVRSVRANGTSMHVADGPAVLSFYVDETEQHAAQTRLAQSQRLLTHLIDACPDSISLSEADTGRYVLANRAFTRITGYTAAEAIGRSGTELGLWARPEEHSLVVEKVRAKGRIEHFRTQSRRRDGTQFPLMLSGASFSEEGRGYLVTVCRDTTEIDRTRLELEAILQRASIGIAYTRERKFFHANAQFEQMFGWGPGELHGQPGSVTWPSAEAFTEARRVFAAALSQSRSVDIERQLMRRDGSLFWCRIMGQVMCATNPLAGTIWIAEDVTERRRVEQALASARDAAEAASRAKSAFLANMSHEIRTPLNGLMGLARLAQHEDLPAVRQQEYLRQIVDSAQSLSDVLSDVLDLSKVEAGKLTVENRPFDLADVLHKIHRAYLPLAQARGLGLVLEIDRDLPPWLHGDLVRVRQIVTNFVTNALKFTAKGAVQLRARPGRDTAVYIEVQDSGIGIDAATQARLFRPFTQADESTTRRFGGTGLGLSICHELAALMGGAVGVSSQAGQGSRFWVELSLPRAEARPVAPEAACDDEQPLAGARLLVAEDNPVNMMIAVAMLEQWGAEVEQAADGRAAIERVDQAVQAGRPFDAVLMDVQMPEMGGHEATRVLRRRYGADDLPVLGLTAAALVEERDAGLAAGMNDFLTKPIEPDRLRAALSRWCGVGIHPA